VCVCVCVCVCAVMMGGGVEQPQQHPPSFSMIPNTMPGSVGVPRIENE